MDVAVKKHSSQKLSSVKWPIDQNDEIGDLSNSQSPAAAEIWKHSAATAKSVAIMTTARPGCCNPRAR